MVRKTILAISTLIGTIVGAGIFGIPFVVMKSSFPIGLIHILILTIIMIIINLYLGEIALRTKQSHHLTGYAEKYLGNKGKLIMFIAVAFGICAAIIAYLIGIGESLSFLFFESTSYSLQFGLLFWLIMSITCYFGIKALEEGEFLGVTIILILIILIAIFFSNKIDITNLYFSKQSTLSYFAPFGVVFFALLGYTTIPEVKRILKNKENKMKQSIIIATLICAVIYIVFAAIVLGFRGADTPEIATLALGKPFVLFGIFTMFTSYLALSVALIDMLKLDFNIRKIKAWFFTSSLPLILFFILELTKSASFIKVLGIGGVISGGLTAILILSIINNAKIKGDRRPEYSIPTSRLLTFLLILIFVIGTIIEIINTI